MEVAEESQEALEDLIAAAFQYIARLFVFLTGVPLNSWELLTSEEQILDGATSMVNSFPRLGITCDLEIKWRESSWGVD